MASQLEIKTIEEFINRWQGHGDEKQETQRFWIDLLQNVLHQDKVTETTLFEHKTSANGYIDVWVPNARFLVEQKSAGINLDKPEIRQNTPVTPIEQALRYANSLRPSQKPAIICTCNFEKFRFYDLEQDPAAKSPIDEFTLKELKTHIDTLHQIFSETNSKLVVQQKLSENAGLLVANLHKSIAKQYGDFDDKGIRRSLATLTVRLVFCMYAEDSGLFQPDSFTNYIKETPAPQLRRALIELFTVLDTKPENRDRYLEPFLKIFPYVNGGLFSDSIAIPPLTEDIRNAILNASETFQWHDISPVIFGSLMEETLSHTERRRGGMHYTSVENIHRLIDPLFLDDLKQQFSNIENNNALTARQKVNRFTEYQNMLASLKFLDPACGSGNFLTETYIQLRQLENRALQYILKDQGMFDLGGSESPIKVSIDQFHGIEINDFAVQVAKTALWIAEQQALDATEAIGGQALPHLPLHDSGNIVEANAVRYDWNDLLPAEECSYIMGNPPFIGHSQKTKRISEELRDICGVKDVDYVAAWLHKSSAYLHKNSSASFAFVSTNSITQGAQVTPVFKPLFDSGYRIHFAHQTFRWNAQSTDNANVHVVIVGLTKRVISKAKLYSYTNISGTPQIRIVDKINAYLISAPNIFITARSQKNGTRNTNLDIAVFGSMPVDGGNLLINTQSEYDEITQDPVAYKYTKRYVNSKELINNINRWCFWLVDAEPSEIRNSSILALRVSRCKEFREASPKTGDAYKNRHTPWLFRDNHQPSSNYICIPSVFSEHREYATCAYLSKEYITGNACFVCPDPKGLTFSIIESKMFMVWQKTIGGRLKSDCRFSNTLVWNNLPLPPLSEEMKQQLILAGKNVLEARKNHPGQSLADIYDPNFMPQDLRKAHLALDKVADVAFGAKQLCTSDDERLEILFRSYAQLTNN
ncbi:hypothetical protein HMPREF9156_00753 [Scardovia wiggsiae F0424]|uniref:site-specific DNA-methyltransferase (adenine-specific) n=1 Tax=Scardovia wiggsiae F0424 TaxID=857290 RepID=J0DF14_9BIFI|nr:DNA methyltransferase [Scardovia wiggsiae]EJD64878.1 hypothetical protein HMPREF9156_00753 [Scardovia wiggsiae F0424]